MRNGPKKRYSTRSASPDIKKTCWEKKPAWSSINISFPFWRYKSPFNFIAHGFKNRTSKIVVFCWSRTRRVLLSGLSIINEFSLLIWNTLSFKVATIVPFLSKKSAETVNPKEFVETLRIGFPSDKEKITKCGTLKMRLAELPKYSVTEFVGGFQPLGNGSLAGNNSPLYCASSALTIFCGKFVKLVCIWTCSILVSPICHASYIATPNPTTISTTIPNKTILRPHIALECPILNLVIFWNQSFSSYSSHISPQRIITPPLAAIHDTTTSLQESGDDEKRDATIMLLLCLLPWLGFVGYFIYVIIKWPTGFFKTRSGYAKSPKISMKKRVTKTLDNY